MGENDERRDAAPPGRAGHDKPPPAGPHERADLADESRTPGAGSLPERGGGEADAGVG